MGRSSSKREEIYAFLKDYIASHGYPPTTREIMAGVGLRSTASVHYHLSELSRSGAIEMDGGKNRAISLGAEAAPQGVPLVGVVTAGQPILAVENIEGYVPWEAEAGCFALRVRGDSMIEAGIFDGDKVVVRPQQTAETVRSSWRCSATRRQSSACVGAAARSGSCRRTPPTTPSTAARRRSSARSRPSFGNTEQKADPRARFFAYRLM